ncbi:hypothetical protein [Pararobbsia alpina]|uniref:hypothetical protein n=1 Tax=Pararobbsia alpina TaxID=621374 RepID=UPI0039A4AA88
MSTKRALMKLMPIACLFVSAFLALYNFFPSFDGVYHGSDRDVDVLVTKTKTGFSVVLSLNDFGAKTNSTYRGEVKGFSLNFGEGLDRQAIKFHPFDHTYELASGNSVTKLKRSTEATQFASRHMFVVLMALVVIVFIAIFFILETWGNSHPELIHPVWLTFFYALFLSGIMFVVAGDTQMLDVNGNALNKYGEWLTEGVEYFLDLKTETYVLGVAVVALAVPQWLAYLFAGINGCARKARYLDAAWRLAAMFLAKSFISASSVAISVLIVGRYYRWLDYGIDKITLNIATCLMLLLYGFILIFVAHPKAGKSNAEPKDVAILKLAKLAHAKMTRKIAAAVTRE